MTQMQQPTQLPLDVIQAEGMLARKLAEKCAIIENLFIALTKANTRIRELEAEREAVKTATKELKK